MTLVIVAWPLDPTIRNESLIELMELCPVVDWSQIKLNVRTLKDGLIRSLEIVSFG